MSSLGVDLVGVRRVLDFDFALLEGLLSVLVGVLGLAGVTSSYSRGVSGEARFMVKPKSSTRTEGGGEGRSEAEGVRVLSVLDVRSV